MRKSSLSPFYRKRNQIVWVIIVTMVLLCSVTAVSYSSVREVLSVKTGRGSNSIGNQFEGVPMEPFNGFAVDSDGNILISDPINSRVIRFSQKSGSFTTIAPNKKSSFTPQNICLDENDNSYVYNDRQQEIIVFSQSGEMLISYKLAAVFQYKYKNVPIISLACDKKRIEVVFGAQGPKRIRPVYQDEYDQNFKLLNRKVFEDEAAYYKEVREAKQGIEVRFGDSCGNRYGYQIVKDWYGKFLPLSKYSPEGVLLCTIDGSWLTRHTKYNVYDYYSKKDVLILGLNDMRGNDFMIVNWYVTPAGDIYALLANNDYVKVFLIK